MGEKERKKKKGREIYQGFGGIAEAGGTIPWLIIKIGQSIAKKLKKKEGRKE